MEFHRRQSSRDNGSEFINHAAEIWRENERLPFTRSRDHKKNDNCFVEQKNGAVVREYAGYDRLEGLAEQALLSDVYTPVDTASQFLHAGPKAQKQDQGGFQGNQDIRRGTKSVSKACRERETAARVRGLPSGALRPLQPGGTPTECQQSSPAAASTALAGKPQTVVETGRLSVTASTS
ncbi:MAG: hypothetical protein LBJ35_00520 [Spirochaetaceae bacterium]|nr:hypothetical protein [Spirochaetaceae bacterium]